MKLFRGIVIALAVYLFLGLSVEAAIGVFQPQRGGTAVLRTRDAAGQSQDTVLGLLDDGGQLWVESGHWFRGWYHRVLANPDVELVREGKAAPYHAVPLDTPEAHETVTRLTAKGSSLRFWVTRALLLFAPIKPVRLDPRPGP